MPSEGREEKSNASHGKKVEGLDRICAEGRRFLRGKFEGVKPRRRRRKSMLDDLREIGNTAS